MRNSEIPASMVGEGTDQPKLEADFTCVQGRIEGERKERRDGLVEVKMYFYTFEPNPSIPARKPFSCSAIMTKKEYSDLSKKYSGYINPNVNPMVFSDDEDNKGNKFVITPKAKTFLEEERTQEAVTGSIKNNQS